MWNAGDIITAEKLNQMENLITDSDYTRTEWQDGDIITAEKLNNMELALSNPTREWNTGDEMTATNLEALYAQINADYPPKVDTK